MSTPYRHTELEQRIELMERVERAAYEEIARLERENDRLWRELSDVRVNTAESRTSDMRQRVLAALGSGLVLGMWIGWLLSG